MSSEEIAISVRDVTKHYVMFQRPEDRLKQMIVPRLQRLAGRPPSRYFRHFAALSNVSFDVRRGETIGIVGRNGSGKSTLLQIICGTLQPTAGTVQVNGRVAALLELGAGFNTEFTGRENVYLNATIQGLSKAEIDARFDSIAAFADIGQFIDQPVKTYSSGMYVRLAFATAVNVDPEILVVDEALAVGDEAFQRKCFARIEDIKAKGGTILFVSHSAQSIVQLCDRALLIDGGEKIMDGRPKLVVDSYQKLIYAPGQRFAEIRSAILSGMPLSDADSGDSGSQSPPPQSLIDLSKEAFIPSIVPQSALVYPENGSIISDVRILNSSGEKANRLVHGQRYTYRYECRFTRDLKNVLFHMLLKTPEGLELFGQTSHAPGSGVSMKSGQMVTVSFSFQCLLLPGTYFGNAGVTSEGEQIHRIVDATMFAVAPFEQGRMIHRYVNLALESDSMTLMPVQIEQTQVALS